MICLIQPLSSVIGDSSFNREVTMLRRKKVTLALVLLVATVGLLFYNRFCETTEQFKAVKRYLNPGSFKACAKECRCKNEVLRALLEDGFQISALSNNMTLSVNSSEVSESDGEATSSRTTFLPTESTTGKDSRNAIEIELLGSTETCTERLLDIENNASVPNVVHYVFIGSDFQFKFTTYLSFLSVERFVRPDQIFIHGDAIPSGKWWKATVEQVKNIYHVQRSQPTAAPNGQPFKFMAHVSDYIRAEILLRYGGIYLDPDVLVLKSFNPLREFPFVLGRETEDSVCNGIIIARRGAQFLRLMLEQYWSYLGPDEEWAKLSVHNVHTLAKVFPHLVHVEETSLNRPNWREITQIYDGNYNWKNNYAIHLWLRVWPTEKRPSGLDDVQRNTTFGEIARSILFGEH